MSLGEASITALDPEDIRVSEEIFERKERSLGTDAVEALARQVLQSVASLHEQFPTQEQLPPATEVERFSQALISTEPEAGQKLIEVARSTGASLDVIYLGYLTEAARLLGEWWNDDRASSADVVLGTGRIYGIMRSLRPVFAKPSPRRHAMFAAVPGETHTLGVGIAADMLRERGWDIHLCVGETHEALVNCLGSSDDYIIGLSASSPALLLPLSRLVVALRIKRPEAFILISGHITVMDPNLGDVLDADLIVQNAEHAIIALEKLVTD